jgi:hypothetical protein
MHTAQDREMTEIFEPGNDKIKSSIFENVKAFNDTVSQSVVDIQDVRAKQGFNNPTVPHSYQEAKFIDSSMIFGLKLLNQGDQKHVLI